MSLRSRVKELERVVKSLKDYIDRNDKRLTRLECKHPLQCRTFTSMNVPIYKSTDYSYPAPTGNCVIEYFEKCTWCDTHLRTFKNKGSWLCANANHLKRQAAELKKSGKH
jgi:hypothetical protein